MEPRLVFIEQELRELKESLSQLQANVMLCINYIKELSTIMGARERLLAIDRELRDQEKRDTDMPPGNGD